MLGKGIGYVVTPEVTDVCVEHTIMQTWDRVSVDTDMMRRKTISFKFKVSVDIVQRGGEQSITHRHAPMLPTLVKIMVIIIVACAYLYRNIGCVVMVDGARLMCSPHIFVNNA